MQGRLSGGSGDSGKGGAAFLDSGVTHAVRNVREILADLFLLTPRKQEDMDDK